MSIRTATRPVSSHPMAHLFYKDGMRDGYENSDVTWYDVKHMTADAIVQRERQAAIEGLRKYGRYNGTWGAALEEASSPAEAKALYRRHLAGMEVGLRRRIEDMKKEMAEDEDEDD